jgi:cytoskeletal protein CcmA (bactofilin family)
MNNALLQPTSAPTLIAEGSRVQGALTFSSSTHVFGVVEGEIIQQSLEPLFVGKGGWVHGSLSSQGPVHIEGRVDGNVYSNTSIRLLPGAQVTGALIAPKVEIRPGALLEGEITMRWARNRAEFEVQAA